MNIKLGSKIVPRKNSNSHNYELGKTYEVYTHTISMGAVCTFSAKDPVTGTIGNTLLSTDCELAIVTRDELKEELERLEREIDLVQAKLDWMDEFNADTLNPEEFRVFHILQEANYTGKTLLERSRAIVKILNENA